MASCGVKRKERVDDDCCPDDPRAETSGQPPVLPASKNRLLAGYLANEFLTRGTLFGRKPEEAATQPARPTATEPAVYADVAWLLKAEGARVPGVVNPSQLALWLQR